MLHQLEEGVVFKRDMFVGGFRGLAAPAQPPSRVVKKGKRKCNARLLPKEMPNGEASSSKKLKMRSQRSKFASVDPNSKLLAAVSSQIRAGLKESQSAVYANLCIDIKEMELRLQQSFKQNIFSVVAEYLAAKDTVNTVVDALGSGGGRPVSHLNQDPVQHDPLLSDPYAPAKLSSPKVSWMLPKAIYLHHCSLVILFLILSIFQGYYSNCPR